MISSIVLRAAAATVLTFVAIASPAAAQQRAKSATPEQTASTDVKARTNDWTIGLAGGRTEGAPLRLAAELARALDDGAKMRVIPMVTHGPFDNVRDLLYLKGVDAAILFADNLEHFEKVEKVQKLHDHINYVASLFPSEIHILARPEIKSIEDLAGKKVNFNSRGTAASFTGPAIFKKLGIEVQEAFDPHPKAMEAMRQGTDYAAVFWATTKPVDVLTRQALPAGFKLLAVPYTRELEETYLPAALEHKDYPRLIPEGTKIQTVSVPTVLAVYNWPQYQERHKRVARFIDYVFERLPQLQQAPFDPAWKSVNLQAPVPGWKRHPLAQSKLDQLMRQRQAASTQPLR